MTTDYAEGHKLLKGFFVRRRIDPATAEDLAQDTWIRYITARARGSLPREGLGSVKKMAGWVLGNHHKRGHQCHEQPVGEFLDEAGLIQLYPEGGYKEPSRRGRPKGISRYTAETVAALRADQATGMSQAALAAKHHLPKSTIQKLLRREDHAA